MFLVVPLFRCIFARKGRQEGENGRHVLWLSSFRFPQSLALRQKSLEFRARLCSREKYGEMKRLKRREVINVVSYCCSRLLQFGTVQCVIGIARVVCKWLGKQLYFCVVLLVNVLLQFGAVHLVQLKYWMLFGVAWRSLGCFGVQFGMSQVQFNVH